MPLLMQLHYVFIMTGLGWEVTFTDASQEENWPPFQLKVLQEAKSNGYADHFLPGPVLAWQPYAL